MKSLYVNLTAATININQFLKEARNFNFTLKIVVNFRRTITDCQKHIKVQCHMFKIIIDILCNCNLLIKNFHPPLISSSSYIHKTQFHSMNDRSITRKSSFRYNATINPPHHHQRTNETNKKIPIIIFIIQLHFKKCKYVTIPNIILYQTLKHKKHLFLVS